MRPGYYMSDTPFLVLAQRGRGKDRMVFFAGRVSWNWCGMIARGVGCWELESVWGGLPLFWSRLVVDLIKLIYPFFHVLHLLVDNRLEMLVGAPVLGVEVRTMCPTWDDPHGELLCGLKGSVGTRIG